MLYAQVEAGQKLHLVYEPGEGHEGMIVRKGYLGMPLCGRRVDKYRMNINASLGNGCKNCRRVFNARTREDTEQ